MAATFKSYSSGGMKLFQLFRISGEKSSSSLNHNTTVAFQLILKGEGKYFVNYRCYDFHPGCLLVSRPKDNQRCMPKPGCFMDKFCLRFPSAIIGDFLPLSVYRCLPYVVCLSTGEAAKVGWLMREINEDIKNKPVYWYKKMLSEILNIIIILYRSGQRKVKTADPYPELRRAMEYIEDNFRTEIDLPALCKKFDYSVSRFSHIFQEEIRMGIKHYIIQRRMAEAKLLLNSRHLEVRVISRQVGYDDIKLFLHQFKRFTTMTPEDYRAALFDDQADQAET